VVSCSDPVCPAAGHCVRDSGSVAVPAIDLAFLASFLDRPGSTDTIVEFDTALAVKLGR